MQTPTLHEAILRYSSRYQTWFDLMHEVNVMRTESSRYTIEDFQHIQYNITYALHELRTAIDRLFLFNIDVQPLNDNITFITGLSEIPFK